MNNAVSKDINKLTVYITEQAQKIAKKTQVNVQQIIADKSREAYINNILATYAPSGDGSYVHTGIFVDSVYTEINGDDVNVMLADTEYPNRRSTIDVYEFLTKGTHASDKSYAYQDDTDGMRPIKFAHNYSTPVHPFEQHAQLQIEGFLESLDSDIKEGKYSK